MAPKVLEHLAAVGIDLLAEGKYCMFGREGFVAIVEHTPEGFGTVGSAGVWKGQGLAYLVWKDGSPFFVNKGSVEPAETGRVAALRRFSADLEEALRQGC